MPAPSLTTTADGRPRSPLGEVWSIAWPTVLTMTSYTVMQFVDKIMVAQIGPVEVAAQGNGGIWSFTPIAFAYGVLTVVNTFVSQNLGAGRAENGPKYAWAGFWLSVMLWVGFLLPWGFVLPWVFAAMHDPATVENASRLIELESDYARILIGGSIFLMLAKSVHNFFFGMHRPKIVTVSALVGNSTNVIANYVLIFGEQGLPALGLPGIPGTPALGLHGAAIGTVIGTLVEVAIPMAVFLGPMHREVRSRTAWRPRWRPIADLLRIGWPASVQFGNEIVCWSIFMTILVGNFGDDHMTAGWATLGYMHLSFMPAVGCSVAVTSLVGRYIGAGQPETAVARARLGLGLAMIYMTACAVAFFVFREPMIDLFVGGQQVTPEQAERIIRIGARLMICAAVFQTMDAFGIVYTGALRGAGDTVWPGVVTVLYSWLFIVGGGWATVVLWPEIESVGPWIAAAVYIILFGITMGWRFESGAWRSINLLRETPGPAGIAPPAEAEAPLRGEIGGPRPPGG
jgi:MATE family multidrug resistance protein